jgi:hypothetical protein
MKEEITMAILDTGSIVLLVLAVLIAPIVLPAILRLMAGEKDALDVHAERIVREDPRGK